jgi:hypothetical protein
VTAPRTGSARASAFAAFSNFGEPSAGKAQLPIADELLSRPREDQERHDDDDENERNPDGHETAQGNKSPCCPEKRDQNELSISFQICHGALPHAVDLPRCDAVHRVGIGTALQHVSGDPVNALTASNTTAGAGLCVHPLKLSSVVEKVDDASLRGVTEHSREYPSFEGHLAPSNRSGAQGC